MKKAIFAALLTLAIAMPALSTTLVRVSFNDQAVKADLVIVGKALRVQNTEQQGFPLRRTIISVEEVVAGNSPGAEIGVIQPGGRRRSNGNEIRVVGVKPINPGDEVFLMLKRLPDGNYQIIGMNQGQYRISKEARTGRKLIEIGDGSGQLRAMTLDAAKGRVRAVRANAAMRKNGQGGQP